MASTPSNRSGEHDPNRVGRVRATRPIGTAIEALANIAEHGSSEAARVSAACAILDRAYGKPMQASVDVFAGKSPQAFNGWSIDRAVAS